MDLQVRNANNCDIPALKALWAEAFGDSPDYIDFYFSRRFLPEETYLLTDESGALLSTLTAMQATLIQKDAPPIDGRYIYAVATPERCRGKGYAKLLHRTVCEILRKCGVRFACLVPAEKTLHDFYASVGYEEFFPIYTGTVAREEAIAVDLRIAEPAAFTALRASYIDRLTKDKTPLFHPIEHTLYIYEELTACGGKLLTGRFDGEAVYAAVLLPEESDTLYIRETSADPVRMAKAVLAVTGRTYAEVRHAYPFPGSQKLPYGMLYRLDDTPIEKEGYMALMLD